MKTLHKRKKGLFETIIEETLFKIGLLICCIVLFIFMFI